MKNSCSARFALHLLFFIFIHFVLIPLQVTFWYVNLETTTDEMNGQIQDDDEESKENHEGRRKEKRDLKIPRKRKKVKMMVSDLLERVEEKDQTRKDKEFCIEQFLEELEREKREKLQQHQRLSEVEEEKENLSIEIRNLVRVLNERDQNLSLANEELEKKSASVSRLQNDLRRLQSESQNLQAVRDMSEQQLSAKEVDFRALQANLDKEQQARQRLEEELLQSKRTCAELERGLENERSFSQSNQQAAQTKEETTKEQMRQLEQERELKLGLEERVRGLQAEVDEGRVRKVSIGKFHCLEPRHCEDIKEIVGPKCFGTFEKQAPDLCFYTLKDFMKD